ncbi:hypothetical protein HMPREF0758_3020 [Serratia odorifera DSM 4582]|uniref:Uncharacterized protein n=1 Tax=Serratia odorifera DSM 4582 TaxID=667129 RepID=D4E4C0_SEROD|nr:hypothetical protein HMPREF0758_3020 [Serratia odorifera DSM 4582]
MPDVWSSIRSLLNGTLGVCDKPYCRKMSKKTFYVVRNTLCETTDK